ncbi:MAG: hypothetical protein JWM63_3497 [Gammaproteobacteria bacterium]|jgi:uncharacterized protein YbaP (TraB family)|nr:hypothetical protein [Gammaproteobacteria bacterium]
MPLKIGVGRRAAAWAAVLGALAILPGFGPGASAEQQATANTPDPTAAAAAAQEAPTEEIVITGEHEGPRLWKVRKGDHVLWILGTVTPLPKKMIWQSAAVETLLQQTQEVVPSWPAFGIGANPFTALRLYIQWRRMQKIPDRMNLQEVLPPPLYARFSALKARYAPRDNKLNELRPMLAAQRLLEEALDASGLTMHNEVQQTVLKLARKQDVRIQRNKLKVEDPVDVLKDVNAAPRSGEIECLEAVVARLETDLGPMQARARAWALGDVDTLRKLNHPDDYTACLAAVSTSERVRSLVTRAQNNWMIAVEDGLARNQSTLAVQSMDLLLGDHGTLATLREKGYVVEGP